MIRIFQSILVTGFFLTMAFFLFRDHIMPDWTKGDGIEIDRSVLTDAWSNEDEWLDVSLGDYKLGGYRTVTEYEELENYYLTASHIQLDLPFLKGRLISSARMNRNLELESYRIRLNIPPTGKEPMSGQELDSFTDQVPPNVYEIVGLVEGLTQRMRIRSADGVQYKKLSLSRPMTMADSITPLLRSNMLTRDITYAVDIYDPMWGNNAGAVELEWVDTVPPPSEFQDRQALKKIELRYSGTTTTLLVDNTGTVMRRTISLLQTMPGQTDLPSDIKAGLQMDRLDPGNGRRIYPGLNYIPEAPTITRDDVTGEDSGQVVQRTSLMSLISGASGGANLFGKK